MLDREKCIQRATFSKPERLHHSRKINTLFNRGVAFHEYPLKTVFMLNEDEDYPFHQVLVSVSRKRFPRAVDRNRIKRLLREAYRCNKKLLYERSEIDRPLIIAYIYTGKVIVTYQLIEDKLKSSLLRLSIN